MKIVALYIGQGMGQIGGRGKYFKKILSFFLQKKDHKKIPLQLNIKKINKRYHIMKILLLKPDFFLNFLINNFISLDSVDARVFLL